MKDWAKVTLAHEDEFLAIFKLQLRKYMSSLTGFDIIKFDEWLQSGDRAASDVVRERYGQRAVDLLTEIIRGDYKE